MAQATKAAREFAAEHEIDLDSVEGTGSGGKITKEDVTNAHEQQEDNQQEEERSGAVEEEERVGAGPEAVENNKNRNALVNSLAEGQALRSQLKTTTADMYDSKLKQQAAINRGGRDLPGKPEKGVIGQASGLVQRIAAPSEGGNMAEELYLVFNPDSGTSRVMHEGEHFEPGQPVSAEKFEELKQLKSDGVLIFDEEATLNRHESDEAPVEQQMHGENLRDDADSDEEGGPDQADANDAEDSTSSADENKED